MSETALSIGWKSRPLALLAGAIVIIMTISRVAPAAARDDIYLDDAQQHIYWMYRYADPTLFPDDLSIEYFGSPAVVTPGYGAIYAVLAPYVDPQLLSELLAGVLMLVCGWLSMLIGARAAPRWPDLGALTAVVTLVALHLMVALTETAALQRSFALPALMLCVWALMARRMVWLGASFVVAALFYPVVIAVLGVCSLIVGGVRVAQERRLPRRWWAAVLLGVVALGVIGMRDVPDDVGPLVTLDEARTMPEFQPGGRQQLFIDDPVHYYITSARTGFRMSPLELALIALAVAVVTVSPGPRSLPLEGWALLGSALLCWVLAHGLMFAMYLPNRHVTWAMPLAVIILIAAALPQWLVKLRSRVDLHRQWLICGGLLAVWLGLGGYWMTATWMSPRAHDREAAYAFLATLPRDTLIAAHPFDANPVPLRTRRSVLASHETAIAFYVGYYRRLKPRIEASLAATYATDWETVDALAQQYGVDAFLVTPRGYDQTAFFQPFQASIDTATRGIAREDFVLLHPPEDRILFRSGDVMVVRVGPATSFRP